VTIVFDGRYLLLCEALSAEVIFLDTGIVSAAKFSEAIRAPAAEVYVLCDRAQPRLGRHPERLWLTPLLIVSASILSKV
jgi:hypothetical protein